MTPEETVQQIYDAIEWGGQSDLAIEILNQYANSHHQLLLDEVNRLNGVIAGSCGNFTDGLG